MADPTFSKNVNATVRRQKDFLEIAFRPSEGAAVFERIPLASEIGGFQPQSNVTRKPLYVDGDGKMCTLVAIVNEGGNIQFATAASSKDATFKKLFKAAKEGVTVLYKAHYVSAGITIQGEAALQDRGMQGGPTDIPDRGFTLEAISAEYLDTEGAVIA